MPNKRRYERAKLVKLVSQSKAGEYRPAIGDVLFWYDNLNEHIFKNQLPPLTAVQFGRTRGYWAEASCQKYENEQKKTEIKLSFHFESFKKFVEIIGHEMVHVYEYYNNGYMSHGPNFYLWESEFQKLGLELKTKM